MSADSTGSAAAPGSHPTSTPGAWSADAAMGTPGPALTPGTRVAEEYWWLADCPLTAEQFAAQEALPDPVPGEAEPLDEDAAYAVDPDCGPPVGADFWLGQLPGPVLEDVLAERAAAAGPPPVPPFPDQVTGHDGTGPGWAPFASGSVLDLAPPGPVLAGALEDVVEDGLENLTDDQLAGVMLAGRRLESRGAATLLAATAELSRRRVASGDRQVIEHADNEVGILLALTRRAAGRLLLAAADVARLPATSQALYAGRIDRVKAELIGYETGLLDVELAVAVEQLVIGDAPGLTASGLRARLRHAVLKADPAAARRRVQRAARDARVELYDERSGGTAALAGRDLPVRGALAADQRVDAAARALKRAGVKATLAQLRAAVFLGLLTGTDPRGFLPSSTGDNATDTGSAVPGATDTSPGTDADPEPADAGEFSGGWPGKLTLRGSVHLTMPLATWLGAAKSPGEIAAFGPVTAQTCQDVADWIAENPGSRWCLTLTGNNGRAIAHGCARRPPPPVSDTGRLAAWLARLKISPLEAGQCTHAREVPGYRIPDPLHHAVKVRQRTCINPICRRPAPSCDDDHTTPYDQGGRTCECGLGPACRKCHRTKQAPGFRLEQPSPGVLVWHLPCGRSFTVYPDPYPT